MISELLIMLNLKDISTAAEQLPCIKIRSCSVLKSLTANPNLSRKRLFHSVFAQITGTNGGTGGMGGNGGIGAPGSCSGSSSCLGLASPLEKY